MSHALRAALAALLLAAPSAAPAQEAGPRVIQVTGEGRSAAAPDLARVSLGVAHQAKTAGEAMDMMSEGVTAVLAVLEAQGIAPADVQTGQLLLEPAYDYNASYSGSTPPLVGFVATQMLDVRVRDLASLGTLLDAVVTDGANRLNGVSFDVDDPEAALDEARRAAVADAADRAALYAEATGLGLGPIVSISEGGGVVQPFPLFAARDAAEGAMAVPVAPGEVNLSAFVTITYAIQE